MPFFLRERKNSLILIILILFNLILISIQVPLGDKEKYLEKAFFSVFSPLQSGVTRALRKIGDVWNNYFYLLEVQKQNRKLKDELFLLRQENIYLRKTLEKIRDYESVQELISSLHDSFIIARVIGVDARDFYKSMIIDKGLLDGVNKDMTVLDKKGNLVGRIIKPITLKEARIQLITDNDSGVSVISRQKGARGVVSGDGKGKCDLKYILATQDVVKGEELVTSGYDHIYSSGIRVGKIVSITSRVSLFKDIKVTPYFQFRDLDLVVIISKSLKESF